ncbi:MAG: GNAT family N-acetyltransferase [Alistipes sp.]|nr:GNAT family N-acetyltransferase [Alistipes senegalensis]MCM1250977.1 GNAT family N-acetyltransferase [Alistipes sp.]
MEVRRYRDEDRDAAIGLILDIQNREAKIDLSLAEQPDLLDIGKNYIQGGGDFWIAEDDGYVVGTLGLMKHDAEWGILKKFFVRAEYRSCKVGLALYDRLLEHARRTGLRHILLDTPAVATKSHAFYERAGFHRINESELPIAYVYPDRESYLYRLDL